MRSAIRWFPAFVGTFVLGFYVGSPLFARATKEEKWCVAAADIVAVVIATAILCAITRGKKQQKQQGRFARASTGRS